MQVVITAVGPDHRGLADPIVHYVTSHGANIAEIQMYDHDEERLFAMLLRMEFGEDEFPALQAAMREVGESKGLSIRVWSPDLRAARPRVAICTTLRPETPHALLRAMRDGQIRAEPALVIGNRNNCRYIADQFGVDFHSIGDDKGKPDDDKLIDLCDQYEVDYIVLSRYMRVLPPSSVWKYAGGRIINLHHGLLPSFPGIKPYHDAYRSRMLVFGATCHFIVPDLDAGNQTIFQSTFQVPPAISIDDVVRIGQEDNEPRCLVEGVRRVVDREVQLHFHRVVARHRRRGDRRSDD